MKMGPKGPWTTLEDRFWSSVDKTPGHGPSGDCWVWVGGKNGDGYGLVWVYELKRTVLAHRVSFMFSHGRYPEPCGLHHCDMPACIRPEHIYEGNKKDNCRDMFKRGRANRPRGSRNVHNKLSDANVLEIRLLLSDGFSQTDIAKIFGIDRKSVFQIKTGRTFAYLK